MDSNEVRTFSGKSNIGHFRKVKRRKGLTIFWFIQKNDILPILILASCFLVGTASASSEADNKVRNFSFRSNNNNNNNKNAEIYTNNELQISVEDKNAVSSSDGRQNDAEKRSKMTSKDYDDDKLRKRRLSGESSVMSFYRPTKKVFATGLDHPMALEGKQKRHENEDNEKTSTVEIATSAELSSSVRSPTEVEDVMSEHSIGGINHIPGFSASEERLLEYYDVTSSSDTIFDGSSSSEEESGEVSFDNAGTVTPVDDDLFTDGPFDDEETDASGTKRRNSKLHRPRIDIVSKLLRIVETQALQGANCQPGTDLNLGDRVVNRYAQERFQDAAIVAVNRANWLTRFLLN